MSKEISKLVSSSMRMTILQHFRSFLNKGELDVSDIMEFDFHNVSITAFSTKYEFNIHYRIVDDGVAKSTLFDLGGVAKTEPRVIDRWYAGSISEILEPGDSHPRFEERFELTEDSSRISAVPPFNLAEDAEEIPTIKPE